MQKSLFLALAGLSLLGLTACGSSGGSGGGASLGDSAGESLTDYDDVDDLLTDIEDGTLAAEDTTARTGSVSMTGAVGVSDLGDDENLTLIGDLVVNANFDTDTATGSADGFTLFDEDTDAVDSDVTGSLTMSGGTINAADFDAMLSGTLTESGDDFDVALTLDGGFADNGGTLVVGGGVSGTITGPDAMPEDVEGGFAASE
ncbi:hypothetical protein QTO30_12145 [Yoonia sp. GPGPB17]|uniref:hypothetical protein n=1 Tax=Yoonia sp. GPGPB17 TaxID=3026147 RepID=UPI0030C36659